MTPDNQRIHNQGINPHPLYDDTSNEDWLAEFDISRLKYIFRGNLIWITAIIIGCLSLSHVYLRYTKSVFQSSSILKLENKNDAVVLGLDNINTPQSNNNLRTLSGEIELIKSQLVFEKTLERLPIDVSVYSDGNILNDEKYKKSPVAIQYKIINPLYFDFRFNLKLLSEEAFQLSYQQPGGEKHNAVYNFNTDIINPGFLLNINKNYPFMEEEFRQDFFFIIHSKSNLIAYLEDNLEVEILNIDANTLKVSFKDHNPVKAHDIVATIDSVYLEQTIAHKTKTQEQTLQFLDENLENTEARLMLAEQRLELFMKENKTLDVKSDVIRLIEKIEQLDKHKIDLRLKVNFLDELQDIILSNKDLKSFIPSITDVDDTQLIKLVEELNKLQQEKDIALTRNKENTYVIKSLSLSIENLKSSILAAVSQNRKLVFQQIGEVEKQIRELEKNFLTLPGKETEYTRLKRFYNLYEKYYLLLMEKKAEYGIAKAGMVPNFVILAPADLNDKAIFPKRIWVYLTGMALGFLVSFLLIIVRYLFDRTITSQRDLENHTLATILGAVPAYTKEALDVSRLVVNKGPKSAISEAFRSIRTNLDFVSPARSGKIVSVTSTISGEGKTFVTLNMAGIIAMSGQRVLIIDMDMRKPKVHRAFNKMNDQGMSTILIGRDDVGSCIHPTGLEGLDFISAGPTPPNPSELILRPSFQETITKLKSIYDVILIDTPPVGLVTDAVLLMKQADVPVYVVRANYSKKNVKNTINKLVKNTGFSNLCVILNALNTFNNYGYGYGGNSVE